MVSRNLTASDIDERWKKWWQKWQEAEGRFIEPILNQILEIATRGKKS